MDDGRYDLILHDEPERRADFMMPYKGMTLEEYRAQRKAEMIKALHERACDYRWAIVEDDSAYLAPRLVVANEFLEKLKKAETLIQLWETWVAWIKADIDAAEAKKK